MTITVRGETIQVLPIHRVLPTKCSEPIHDPGVNGTVDLQVVSEPQNTPPEYLVGRLSIRGN